MNDRLRKVLMICLGTIFVCSSGMFLHHTIESKKGAAIYSEAEKLANTSDDVKDESSLEIDETFLDDEMDSKEWKEEEIENDKYLDAMERTNLRLLRDVNEDVLGWIKIPGTQLSYPIVQSDNNDYYLRHTWDNQESIVGSVFIEYLNESDFSDFNTIVYAHHMMDGTMFGSLRNYKDLEHWKKHPYVYTFDDRGSHRYEIFSVYEADIASNTYRVGFEGESDKQEFLDECMGQSVIQTNVFPTVNDRILTLSTCTNTGGYSTRWVVQARLKGAE